MNILQVNSSIYSEHGESSRLGSELVARLRTSRPGARVTVRDLGREPIPHLNAERFAALLEKREKRTPAQHAVVELSDALVAELQRADIIVIGLPMYNFGVPSQLKAWFDHIARAGVTFRYTEQGSVGLLAGKKAYVVAARGGRYAGTPADTQSAYVRDFLAFVGVSDVEFVYAEGLAMGPQSRDTGLAAARARVAALVPERIAA